MIRGRLLSFRVRKTLCTLGYGTESSLSLESEELFLTNALVLVRLGLEIENVFNTGARPGVGFPVLIDDISIRTSQSFFPILN
jgi:hypothetical protein